MPNFSSSRTHTSRPVIITQLIIIIILSWYFHIPAVVWLWSILPLCFLCTGGRCRPSRHCCCRSSSGRCGRCSLVAGGHSKRFCLMLCRNTGLFLKKPIRRVVSAVFVEPPDSSTLKMVPYINMDPETILVLVRTNYRLLFRTPHCLEIPYLLHSQTRLCRCSHCPQYSRLLQRLQVRCGRRYPLLSLDISPDLLVPHVRRTCRNFFARW